MVALVSHGLNFQNCVVFEKFVIHFELQKTKFILSFSGTGKIMLGKCKEKVHKKYKPKAIKPDITTQNISPNH